MTDSLKLCPLHSLQLICWDSPVTIGLLPSDSSLNRSEALTTFPATPAPNQPAQQVVFLLSDS